MKKIFFILLLIISVKLNAQINDVVSSDSAQISSSNFLDVSNTLYFSYQLTGICGVRYDYMKNNIGFYFSSLSGNNIISDISYIKHYIKISSRVLFHPSILYDNVFLSYGLCYHYYGEYLNINKIALPPFSSELGLGMKFNHIRYSFTIDPIKWGEPTLSIGINF